MRSERRACARRSSPPAGSSATGRSCSCALEDADGLRRARRGGAAGRLRRRERRRTCSRRSRTCRAVLAARRDGAGRRRSSLAEWRRLAVLPGRRPRSTWPCGTSTGRRAGQPVWRLLGARRGRAGRGQRDDRRRRPRRRRRAGRGGARRPGFAASSARSGSATTRAGWPPSARSVGPDVAIRLDANGAWSVDEAVATLRALAPVGIELCEEPVHGLEQTRRGARPQSRRCRSPWTRRRRPPGALDDSVVPGRVPEDRRAAAGSPGCSTPPARARAAGYEVYLASTLDGPLGIAAALHAAAVIRPDRACGLATLGLFAERDDPLPPRAAAGSPSPAAPAWATGCSTGTAWTEPGPWEVPGSGDPVSSPNECDRGHA